MEVTGKIIISEQGINMPNPNSSKASRSNMGSNRFTDINVGGGDKKAGLAPTSNVSAWYKLYLRDRSLPQSFASMMLNADGTANVSTVCQSRPTGSDVQFNIYWKCSGLPR
jgi:hypothetical protein